MRGGRGRDDLRGGGVARETRMRKDAILMPMRIHDWPRVAALGASLLVFATCSSSSAAQQARKPLPSDVIATVGDTKITLEQIDERALQQPAGSFGSLKLAQAIFEARRA